MYKITVKTLDGQDRPFDISEDFTIKEFKEYIAPTVGIASNQQRVIFQGRVLKDDKKLKDFDLNGKAVHLVEKPPDRSSEIPQNTVLPPQPIRRREVAQQHIMIGTVAIPIADLNPAELVQSIRNVLGRLGEIGNRATVNVNHSRDGNSLDVVVNLRGLPPVELESPAYTRLQHVRHVLRHINHSLYHMENDDNSPSDASATRASTSDNADRIDATSSIIPDGCQMSSHTESAENAADVSPKPAGPQPSAAAGENRDLDGVEANERNQRRTPRVRDAMVSDLANVFEDVLRLEDRLRPLMQRYVSLLREEVDYAENTDEGRRTSRFFNGMQIIMHNVSHVYHALSDLNIHFCQPPPRVLEPRFSQGETAVTLHEAEAQITMSFRRANAADDGEEPPNRTAPPPPNIPTTSAPSFGFGGVGTPPVPGRINVQVTPNGVMVSQAQTASFTIPVQQQQATQTGNQSESSTAQANNEAPAGQQPPSFFQQLMQSVANAGVILGLAPTLAARQPNPPAASQSAAPSQRPPSLPQQPPFGGFQFGGVPGRLATGQLNAPSTTMFAGFPSRFGFPSGQAFAQQFPPLNIRSLQQQQQQQPPPAPNPNANPMFFRGPRPHAQAVVVNASPSNPVFVGPRPPTDLPLFTVDPFLPCASRHFDLRNSALNRRRDANVSPSTVDQQPQQRRQSPTNGGDGENETLSMNEFESTIEQVLRSVLQGMNDQPITNPNALGMYNFAPVANSMGGQENRFYQSYAPPPASAPIREEIPPSNDDLASILANLAANPNAPAADGTENELQLILSQLLQTLSQNPAQPMSEFMRSVGRDLEEPGASVFSNIVNILTQIVTITELLAIFNRISLAPLDRARSPLRRYFIETVLNGNARPSEDDLQQAVNRVAVGDLEHFEALVNGNLSRENIDLIKSMMRAYETRLLDLLKLCFGYSDSQNFGESFYDIVWLCLREIASIGVHYNSNGSNGFEEMAVNYLRTSMNDLTDDVQNIMASTGREHIRTLLTSHLLPESAVQRHLIYVLPAEHSTSEESETSTVEIQLQPTPEMQTTTTKENVLKRSADEDNNSEEFFDSVSSNVEENSAIDDEWKRHLPPNWVKVVEADVERMRSLPQQKPFSDAYLNGMPLKRRKIVCESKPNLTLDSESLFRQTLQKSINDASVNPVTGELVEDVVNSSTVSPVVLETFEENLKDKIRRRMQHDPDFDEKRYANVKRLFDP